MKTQPLYYGIDVAKNKLHLATLTRFLGEYDNTVSGHQKFVARLGRQAPAGIILEASGGYERLVCEAFQQAQLPVTVAQPGCIRNFAKSLNVLAKTDAIDAKIIAHFGAALAGLAPHPNESGRWKGKRRIYGGRAAVRKAIYMAAKSAARWCPVISEFCARLRTNGKSYNQALIACARKMLIRLNTIMKELKSQPPAPIGTQST